MMTTIKLTHRINFFWYVFIITSLSLSVHAADGNLQSLSLEELLSIPITTATQQHETLRSVPSTITVFERAQIQRMGIMRLEELMNFVPGFQSYFSDENAVKDFYSARGRRSGGSAREILILIDGVRVNDDWSGGSLINFGYSLEYAERVEFIRGPGSALYGSNAVLGVINIVTGSDKILEAAGGSDGYTKLWAQWSTQYQGGETSVFLKNENTDGQTISIYNSDPTVHQEIKTETPYHIQHAYFKTNYNDFTAHIRYKLINTEQYYIFGNVSNDLNSIRSENYHFNLYYQHDLTNYWSVDAGIAHIHRKLDIRTNLIATFFSPVNANSYEKELNTHFRLRYDDHTREKMLIGLDYRMTDHYKKRFFTNFPVPISLLTAPEEENRIKGLLGQYQYRFTDKWEGIAGLRIDDYPNFGSHASPRLGLVHHFNSSNTFKLLSAEAFRAPTWNEQGAMNNPAIIGNPDLQPEIARTDEFIWQHFLPHGYWKTVLFNVEIKDAIVAVNNSPMRINAGRQDMSGVEFEWRQPLGEYWSIQTALTWLPNEANKINTESDTLLGLSLIYQSNSLNASFNINYQGDKEDPVNPDLVDDGFIRHNGFTTTLLNASYQFSPEISAYIRIHNLFDESYLLPAENLENIIGTPSRGRYGSVGLTLEF